MRFSKKLKVIVGRISQIFKKKKSRKGPRKRLPRGPEKFLPEARSPWPSLPVVSPLSGLTEFSELQLSPNTQKAYKKDLQDFFSWMKSQDFWENWNQRIGPQQIAQYREHLRNERKLSKSTVTRRLAVLKSFFKYAVSRGWLLQNPAELVKAFPQNQDSKTGFLNQEQIHQVLDFLKYRGSERLSHHLQKVGVETLLMLGLRRSEACAIRLGHLEYQDERWLLRVQGKGDRERLLPLPPLLERSWTDWIRRLHRSDAPREEMRHNPAVWMDYFKRNSTTPLLISSRASHFESPLSTAELAFIVRKVSRHAGLVQRVSPHMLRASAITFALDQGASHRAVQQMAGWTSPLMISRYDKRRNDPRLSAVHNLSYAQRERESESEPA